MTAVRTSDPTYLVFVFSLINATLVMMAMWLLPPYTTIFCSLISLFMQYIMAFTLPSAGLAYVVTCSTVFSPY
jgi:hypothetical protein